jgi:hypothetical protein
VHAATELSGTALITNYLFALVLLLDEADVFLESRRDGDLARNSLVSGR